VVQTHPDIKVDQHFSFDIFPSPTHSQQSISLNLPPSHYYLRIIPTIGTIASNRQSKLVATLNYAQLKPKPDDADPKRPIFDTRILPGLNTINIEMIAGPPRGAPKSTPGQDLELERITLFVNLMKH